MDTNLLLAALAGGVALFFWGFLSWVVLPWHHATYEGFTDEEDVVAAIERNVPASGIYSLPKPGCGRGEATPEAKKAAREKAMARMMKGPSLHAVVVRGGIGPMPVYMGKSILLGVLASGLAAWLLQKTAIVSTLDRALFVMLVAGVGGFAVHTANWNWHNYPTKHTVVNLLDHAVGWFLAGLVIAWVLPG